MRRKEKEKKGLKVSRPNRGYKRQARRSPGGHRASTKAGQEQKEEKLKEKQGEEGYDSAKMKEAMCVTGDAETMTPRSALLTNAATPVLLALDRSSFGNADICGCQRSPCATTTFTESELKNTSKKHTLHYRRPLRHPRLCITNVTIPPPNRTAVSNRFTSRDPLAPHFGSTTTRMTNLSVPKTRGTDN